MPFGHFDRPFGPARRAWVQFSFKDSRPLMQTYATKDNLTCPSGTSTDHFALKYSVTTQPLFVIIQPLSPIIQPLSPIIQPLLVTIHHYPTIIGHYPTTIGHSCKLVPLKTTCHALRALHPTILPCPKGMGSILIQTSTLRWVQFSFKDCRPLM